MSVGDPAKLLGDSVGSCGVGIEGLCRRGEAGALESS